MSFGIVIVSSVEPRQKLPGWITNGSSGDISTSSVRSSTSCATSTYGRLVVWKTRKALSRRRSTEAGWIACSSSGSMPRRPAASAFLMLRSLRTLTV